MATFEIQGADGKTYEVDAPDEKTALSALGQAGASSGPDARAQAGIGLAQQMHALSPEQKRAIAGVDQETLQPNRVPAFAPPGYNALTDRIEGDDALSKMRTTSGGILEGIPILGPMIRGGVDRAAAATIAGASDETYDQVLKRIQAGTVAEKSMNPNLDKASQVTGAVAGTIPAMAAAPGAFGIGVTSAPLRFGASALTGGLINGTDAAVRSGGDPTATGIGAVTGAGLGVLAPAIGPLVGRGVKYVADGWNLGGAAKELGIDKVAAAMLSRAAGRDALDAGALGQMDKLGPGGMIMDLGENLRSQAGGLAALPGKGKAIVRGAVDARNAGANQRITSTIDQELGPAPIPSRINAGIDVNQANLSPEYRAAFANASPVNTRPIATYLDREIQTLRGEAQRGLQRVRTMLNRTATQELESNPVTLLETRKAIDGMLETTVETNARNALQTARQAVDDELRASVPGIKEVDSKFAELARQREAVGRGQQVLSSGREAPRPAELAQEVQEGALPQGMQIGPSAVPMRLREGARAEIERIVGTNANDRVALQRLIKGEGDWNRSRLATLFGKDRADRIIGLLDREKHFADTTDIVTRNSLTAARQASQQELTGSGAEAFGVPQAFMAGGVAGAARATAMKGVDAVVEALSGIKNEATRSAMAKILTSNDPEVLETLLRAGRGSRVNASEVDKVSRALLLSQGQRSAFPQQ
ncbi:elastin [Mesorhizobium sp. LSJC268A00]|uniref:hypothetical protein n=1 Tax=unclassified Mesorhizobium TaxID=325217 RepID=UPI0003CEF1A7|nr:hypothetical protein [Mesorhizobium sp. LSJC268A00]ESX06791.1 elastin [Mesorhizobium sp. LSJC268A00]